LINLLNLFANNILPIFLAAGAGYWLAKKFRVDPVSVSRTTFNIFSPCLIFHLLTTSQLETNDILRVSLFTVLSTLALGLVAWLLASAARVRRKMMSAILLIAMFGNAGNFGLTLNALAFGDTTLAYASIYFVVLAVMMYTVGVFIASSGAYSLWQAARSLAQVPAVYATVLAIMFNVFHLKFPEPLSYTIELMAGAALPTLLVLLGIQLQHSAGVQHLKEMSLGILLRLVASPVVALAFSLFFGLQGAARQAAVAQAAVPTAVLMTVLATEYDVEPAFVTNAVFFGTLLSPLTLTPLLAYLGAN
jgi:hypothetical protein